MANQTTSISQTLEQLIALGLNNGENIIINGGAIITCTQTPSVLLGLIVINDGELHIDGTSITSGNTINFLGEGGDAAIDQVITVNGQGTFRATGSWFDIGTTDGTNSQVIDLSVATGAGYWDNGAIDFCPATIPMIEIETGRRINYTAGTGLDPIVGDMMTLISDRTVMGKIASVDSTFFVVDLLTGSFAGGELINIRRVVDNFGPDLQVAWTGTVNGADTLEAGVYRKFGNSRSDDNSHIASFGSGYGGLVFDNAFASTDLTLGSTAGGGFVPPNGCNIRTPNINMNSSRTAEYLLNQSLMPSTNNTETDWFGFELSAGGTVVLNTMCASNFMLYDASAFAFSAVHVGAVSNLGSASCANRTIFDHCVVVQDPVAVSEPASKSLGNVTDLVNGAEITNSMVINSCILGLNIGGTTSLDLVVSDCIVSSAGQTPILDTNAVHNYYINGVKKSRLNRNMSFGNDHSSQDQAIAILRGSDHICEDFRFSTTQDYSFQTQEIDTISLNGTDTAIVKNIEVIGDGIGGNNMLVLTDVLSTKIRCIGMIDDKVDFGSDGEFMVNIVGLCDNTDIARCWKTGGIVEEAVAIPTTAKNTTVTSCSGNYLGELQPSGVDTIFRGVHGGAGNYGSNTGWEDSYPSSFGHSIHDGFQSDTNGYIACLMINPSTTIDETTVIAGTPKFFKDGDLDMRVGDIIEFEQSDFSLGHTGFTGNYVAASGTATGFANEWNNTTLDFQWMLEDGAFNGVWLDVRTPANLTGIAGAIEAGIKFKFRFTATGTQLSMSALLLESTTTFADQLANMYPIDQVEEVQQEVQVNNVAIGSRVLIYDETNSVVLSNTIAGTTTVTWLDPIPAIADRDISIKVAYQVGVNAKMPISVSIGTVGILVGDRLLAALVNQVDDDIHDAYSVDGSTVSEVSLMLPGMQVDVDDASGTFDSRRFIAWWRYITQTLEGIEDLDIGAIVYNPDIRNIVVTSGLQINNTNASTLKITEGLWVKQSGELIAPISNTIHWIPDDRVYQGAETGTSGLTTSESNILSAIPSSAEIALEVETQLADDFAGVGGGGGGSYDDTALIAKVDAIQLDLDTPAQYMADTTPILAAISALNDFDPATDDVAVVTDVTNSTAVDNSAIALAVETQLADDFAAVSGGGGGLNESELHDALDSYVNKADYQADSSAIALAVETQLADDFAAVSGGGGGLNESELHDALDSYVNKADYQADVSNVSTFDPATDDVARVTLVDTVTANADMRGTNGANTSIPDNASIAQILIDTSELQTGILDSQDIRDAMKLTPSAGASGADSLDDKMDDVLASSSGGGGLNESELHDALDSYVNKADYQADLSLVAQQATLAGLNDFNPATDVVNSVTLVGTVTNNSDMRGTDGANTSVPDNASIANILQDTNQLQLNQGNWVTAVGFATEVKQDLMKVSIDINSGILGANLDAQISSLVTLLPDERAQLMSRPSAVEVKDTILGVTAFP